ncbi:nicotinate phosphoribosyltransferase [Numidum massiliense]|uniref:nicotinate phosphoribosyltransferase n=1 Tax=Numidum massiliense TaxID=1522315 RepID=UPI0006D53946|nr:nicotinate phosphoribosyltransferase [Numidum massiliense]
MHTPALHTDKYQLNMMYAHWKNGSHRTRCVFDVYFRELPFHNGFAVFAGLERAITYLSELAFTDEEIAFLRGEEEKYDEAFLKELKEWRFTGNVYAMPEGTLVFPNEPLVRVEGSIFELLLIETALLNMINYQTLIATKAARVRHVAPGDVLLEFGSRRAQEVDAAIWGARATYLAGFDGTSNVRAAQLFDIPCKGTHSHAWVQLFDDEIESFRTFVDALPSQTTLLVDTYNTVKSGLPHAIKIGKELEKQGKELKGIRLDSGDLAYLSKIARRMLDEAGLTETKIFASSDLDEHTILHLKSQGAKIDSWGIGTKLITAFDQPALGAVYKMVAKETAGKWLPTIKISSNPEKVTTPGRKTVYRIIDRETNKASGDLIASVEERVDVSKPLTLFHPVHTYRKKVVSSYVIQELLQPIFLDGKLVYDQPTLAAIRKYHSEQLSQFWEEYLRNLNPAVYPVDMSEHVWQTKQNLLVETREKVRREQEAPEE